LLCLFEERRGWGRGGGGINSIVSISQQISAAYFTTLLHDHTFRHSERSSGTCRSSEGEKSDVDIFAYNDFEDTRNSWP